MVDLRPFVLPLFTYVCMYLFIYVFRHGFISFGMYFFFRYVFISLCSSFVIYCLISSCLSLFRYFVCFVLLYVCFSFVIYLVSSFVSSFVRHLCVLFVI